MISLIDNHSGRHKMTIGAPKRTEKNGYNSQSELD